MTLKWSLCDYEKKFSMLIVDITAFPVNFHVSFLKWKSIFNVHCRDSMYTILLKSSSCKSLHKIHQNASLVQGVCLRLRLYFDYFEPCYSYKDDSYGKRYNIWKNVLYNFEIKLLSFYEFMDVRTQSFLHILLLDNISRLH